MARGAPLAGRRRDLDLVTRAFTRSDDAGLLLVSGCYLGVLLVLLALENWFLYPASTAAQDWEGPPIGLDS